MSKAIKKRPLRKGFRHKPGGNCWEGIQSPQAEDVCPRHTVVFHGAEPESIHPPRGECPGCPRCPACDNMNLATSLSAPDHPPLHIVEAPPELYTLNPTASKTDLLFACTYPWGRKVKREPIGERTRFGSAFHQVMEGRLQSRRPLLALAAAGEWGVDLDELHERVDEAVPVVKAWLAGANMWGLDFIKAGIQTEVSVAYNPTTGEARFLPDGPGPNHDYPGREPGEICGTADVVSTIGWAGRRKKGDTTPTTLLVLDHKSGWNVAADWQPQTPAESGQLRTLALGLAKLYKADRVIVAYFHAPRTGTPQVYEDLLTLDDLEAHRKALKAALGNVGSDWLRPGPWCAYCPAFMICPTQTTSLVELKRSGGPLTAERVGAIHQAVTGYDSLRDRLREEMRAWVRNNGPAVRPDGQLIDLVERTKTSLSQASVVRALGALKGGKMLQKLKAAGAIETKTNLELRVVKP
jgi:PD-(D/E)XK nuclease superfamily